MSTVFVDGFDSIEDVYSQWTGAREALDGAELLFAEYDLSYSYEGHAYAVWRKDGKLWEAECGHCSCNGLDDFTPTETSPKAILMRKTVRPKLRELLESTVGCVVHDDCAEHPELGLACFALQSSSVSKEPK